MKAIRQSIIGLPAAATAAVLIGVPGMVPAQEATTGVGTVVEYREVEDDGLIVEPYNLSIDQLEDMDIYGPDGDQIGEVEDVLTDGSGQVVAVAIETEGFLGLGSEDVVVTLDQLQLEGERFVTALTEDEMEALPQWDD